MRIQASIRKTTVIVAIIVAMTVLFALYGMIDPESPYWGRIFPKCPVKLLTGLQCPGCGIQRAAHHLLQGDVYGAISQNWFLLLAIPFLLLLLFSRSFLPENSAIRKFLWGAPGCYFYLIIYIAWFILRNILGV